MPHSSLHTSSLSYSRDSPHCELLPRGSRGGTAFTGRRGSAGRRPLLRHASAAAFLPHCIGRERCRGGRQQLPRGQARV